MIESHHDIQVAPVSPKEQASSLPTAVYALPVVVVLTLLIMLPELIQPLLAILIGTVALIFLISPWIVQIDDFVESRRDRRTQ